MRKKNQLYFEDVYRLIPENQDRLAVVLRTDEKGSVFDIVVACSYDITDVSKHVLPDENGMITLRLYGETVSVSKEWLVCFTYRPLFEAKDFAYKLSAGRQDDGLGYFHPGSLFWIIPEGGVEAPDKDGFFIVPDYSRHCVNHEGVLWSRRMQRFGTVRPSGEGNVYQNTSLVANTDIVDTVGVHRVLARAFLRTESNPEKLTVNHKKGIKTLNSLDRLEWNTYQQNNVHAREVGLNKQRKNCIVRDYNKGEINRFTSANAAAYFYGLNPGILSDAMLRGRVMKGTLEARTANDENVYDWNEDYFRALGYVIVASDIRDVNPTDRKICVYEPKAKKLSIFSSHGEMATFLGKDNQTVLARLSHSFKNVIDGLLICYLDEFKELKDKIVGDYVVWSGTNNGTIRTPVVISVSDMKESPPKQESFSFRSIPDASLGLFLDKKSDYLARLLQKHGNEFYHEKKFYIVKKFDIKVRKGL